MEIPRRSGGFSKQKIWEQMTKEEIKTKVNHAFDGGANEIRIMELVERFVKQAEKETRHKAAEIVAYANSKDDAHRDIMNISILT